MATDPKKPAVPKYDSKLGPIPPDHFDNDIPFDPNVDKSPGSLYDRANKQIDKNKPQPRE